MVERELRDYERQKENKQHKKKVRSDMSCIRIVTVSSSRPCRAVSLELGKPERPYSQRH
jgi:hypothetical protein